MAGKRKVTEMQAAQIKRNPATFIGIAAAAVVLLAAIILGLVLLNLNDEQALSMPASSVHGYEQIKLLEDNIALPVYAGSPARSLAEMRLIEENVEFQIQAGSPAHSYLDIQWMEENVQFQTQMSAPALSWLDIRFIEDNVALPVNTAAVRIHANMEVEE